MWFTGVTMAISRNFGLMDNRHKSFINKTIGSTVTPNGTKIYVANNYGNNVYVIDTTTNKVIDMVSVENGPTAFGQFIGPMRITPTA
jgi:YVTN family beta-propeller protein